MQDMKGGFLIQGKLDGDHALHKTVKEPSCASQSEEFLASSPDAPTRRAKVRLGEDVEGNMIEVSLGMDEPEPTGVDVTPRAEQLANEAVDGT